MVVSRSRTTMAPRGRRVLGAGILVGVALAVAGCEQPEHPVPSTEEVQAYYEATRGVRVDVRDGVAEVTVVQPARQLRRGGTLWARVGPYIFLFSDETYGVMTDFPGLLGVKVVTRTEGGDLVGSAYLRNGALTDVQWRRSLNIAGKARRDGTERPSLLEELVRWGEDRTEHEYNPRYVTR
jgi:hypothetical protein